jgi:hypothetical protein
MKGVRGTTSSRVPTTRPGRPLSGNSRRRRRAATIRSSTLTAARGLSASMCVKMASRSASACCAQTSLTIDSEPSEAQRRGVQQNARQPCLHRRPAAHRPAPDAPWPETMRHGPRWCSGARWEAPPHLPCGSTRCGQHRKRSCPYFPGRRTISHFGVDPSLHQGLGDHESSPIWRAV